MITISLYQTGSEMTSLDKALLLVGSISGTMKSATDLLNPTILIEGDITATLAKANYAFIPEFARYYFITGVNSVRTGLYEVSMHVDVLSTYKAGIRSNMALIRRQENEWNMFIQDDQVQISQHPIISTQQFSVSSNNPGFFRYSESDLQWYPASSLELIVTKSD